MHLLAQAVPRKRMTATFTFWSASGHTCSLWYLQSSETVSQYNINSRKEASSDVTYVFDWWQAIAVPQVRSISFTNSDDASPNLPLALETSPGLQDLYWSGQATQLQQLARIQGDVLSRLTNLSLFLHRFLNRSEDYFLNPGANIQDLSHGIRAFVHLHQLRILRVMKYTPSAPGLLEMFLPLTR